MVEFARIGETCQVGDGTHSKIPRQDSGVLYLTSRNFKDGSLDLSKVYYISEQDYANHFLGVGRALTSLISGDLVFSIIGTIGEPYLVKDEDHFGISSSVAIVRPDRNILDPLFLLYWFKGSTFQNALVGIKGGVAQGYVSLEMIRSLLVPRMPLSAQRRIASILSAYDELMKNNQRRIRLLEAMARAFYREWFVQFRFPGHEKLPRVVSPCGDIPKGWEPIPFQNLLVSMTGGDWGSDQPTEDETAEVCIVRGTDFDEVAYGGELRAPVRFIKPSSFKSRGLRPGDVIVENSINAKSRCIGNTLLVDDKVLARIGCDAVAASFCKVFRLHDPRLAPLVHLHIRHLREDARMEYYQNVAANGIGNFQAQKFSKEEHLILPTDELLRFKLIEKIAKMFDGVSVLASQLSNLRRTRDLLLPRLLTGSLVLNGTNE